MKLNESIVEDAALTWSGKLHFRIFEHVAEELI